LPFSWLNAVDFSQLEKNDCFGTCSKYKASPSAPASDALSILKDAGINAVRVRVWNNPSPAWSFSNLTSVLAMARRVKASGMDFWLDFHYSDTWADPGHQYKPVAWNDYHIDQLVTAIYNYSFTVVSALVAQQTTPLIVAVGNEITAGFLWNPQGSNLPCTDSGALYQSGCNNNWQSFGKLVAAGIAAVRDASPTSTIMLHTDQGNRIGQNGGVATIVNWFGQLGPLINDDYDCIGLSAYPQWGLSNISDITLMPQVAAAVGKPIVIAETAYAFEGNNGGQYPETPAGQLQFLTDYLTLARGMQPQVMGVAWWGAELVPWSTSLFDNNWAALPALQKGWK